MTSTSHKTDQTSQNENIISGELIVRHYQFENINDNNNLYDPMERNKFRHWRQDRKEYKLQNNQQGSILIARNNPNQNHNELNANYNIGKWYYGYDGFDPFISTYGRVKFEIYHKLNLLNTMDNLDEREDEIFNGGKRVLEDLDSIIVVICC